MKLPLLLLAASAASGPALSETPTHKGFFPNGVWERSFLRTEESGGPAGREHTSMWIDSQGLLHVYGGYSFKPKWLSDIFDHWVYDFGQKQWSERKQAEQSFQYHRSDPVSGEFSLVTANHPGNPGMKHAEIPGFDQRLTVREVGFSFDAELGGYSFKYDQERLMKLDYSDPAATQWIAIDAAPPYTELAGFIYDPRNDQYLLFCGIDPTQNNQASCENVYAFRFTDEAKTKGAWSVLTRADAKVPVGRYGFALVHDAQNDRFIVFGGGSTGCTDSPVCPLNDVWALYVDGDSYRWESIDIASPVGGRNGCWAYDPKDNRMFLLGRTADAQTTPPGLEVLELKKGEERWLSYDLPPEVETRSSCTGVYDPKQHSIHFGFGNNPYPKEDIWTLKLQ